MTIKNIVDVFAENLRDLMDDLPTETPTSPFDLQFLTEYQSNTELQQSENTEELTTFILHTFHTRDKASIDTNWDVFINSKIGSQELWIDLAKNIAGFLSRPNLSYLKILAPDHTNNYDPILFSSLSTCINFADLFRARDNKTIQLATALVGRTKVNPRPFSTYFISKQAQTAQPVLLLELYRLSRKTYPQFYNNLLINHMPEWHKKGKIPPSILFGLLRILESYFSAIENPYCGEYFQQFIFDFNQWENKLGMHSVDDINCFYGQKIQIKNKQVYFATVLIDCFAAIHQKDLHLLFKLKEKMLKIGQWLCEDRPNENKKRLRLTGRSPELINLYNSINCNITFDLRKFYEITTLLQNDSSRSIRGHLNYVQKIIKENLALGQIEISQELLSNLRKIYKDRSIEVLGKSKCYTRLNNKTSQIWEAIAYFLKDRGYIKEDVYQYLMPNLKYVIDPVQMEPISNFNLSQYILSESGTSLILLKNSKERFNTHGTFHNCNTHPTQPFTKIEIDRLQYADREYLPFYNLLYNPATEDPMLYQSTVYYFFKMLNNSFDFLGVLKNSPSNQPNSSDIGVGILFDEINALSEDEKYRLEFNYLSLNGNKWSMKKILEDVGDGRCVIPYLMVFVLNYAHPAWVFKEEIRRWVHYDSLLTTANNSKKIFREFEDIDDGEAINRLKLMYICSKIYPYIVSIHNHPAINRADVPKLVSVSSIESPDLVDKPSDDISLDIPGSSNLCDAEIFNQITQAVDSSLLQPMIISGVFKFPRSIYSSIMLKIDCINNNTLLATAHMNEGAQSSLVRGYIDKISNIFFEPKEIILALQNHVMNSFIDNLLIIEYLDYLVKLTINTTETSLDIITVNLKFIQLLDKMTNDLQQNIIRSCCLMKTDHSNKNLDEKCSEWIMYRLLCLNDRPSMFNFFSSMSSRVKAKMTEWMQRFQQLNESELSQQLKIFVRNDVPLTKDLYDQALIMCVRIKQITQLSSEDLSSREYKSCA